MEAEQGIFQFVAQQDNEPDPNNRIRVGFDSSFFILSDDENIDLAAAPLAPILSQLEDEQVTPFYRALEPNLIPDDKQLNE